MDKEDIARAVLDTLHMMLLGFRLEDNTCIKQMLELGKEKGSGMHHPQMEQSVDTYRCWHTGGGGGERG